MGNSTSNTITKVNEIITETTNEFLQRTTTRTTAQALNTQTINLRGATFKNCQNFAISQNIDTSVEATGELSSTTISDLQSALTNRCNEELEQTAAQENGWLSTSIANDVNNLQDIRNSVNQIITNTVTLENLQEVLARAENIQLADLEGAYVECSPYRTSNFIIDQNIKAAVVAEGVATLLTENLTEIITDNSSDTTSKQTATQKNKGLEDVLQALFNALLTPVYASIAVAVIIILIIISSSVAMAAGGGGGKGGR